MRKQKKRKLSLSLREIGYQSALGLFAIIGVVIGLLAIFWAGYSPLFGYHSAEQYLELSSYRLVSNSWQEDRFIDSLAYLCSQHESDKEKLNCVYQFVSSNVEYTPHHKVSNIVRRNLGQIIKKGGVCRDYAVVYSAVLTKMNITNEFVIMPKHIYVKAYLPGNITCRLDTGYFECKNSEKIDLNITYP